MSSLDELVKRAEINFDAACDYAEHIPALADFFGTWARHCGAPRSVFIGHTVRMLVELKTPLDENDERG